MLLAHALLLALPVLVVQDAEPSAYDAEKPLRAAFEKDYRAKDPGPRSEAVQAYSDATRSLADDYGQSRLVARTLAKALEDEDLSVRRTAVQALSWGRDVDTVLDAYEKLIQRLRNTVEKYVTRPGDDDRQHLTDAARLYGEAAAALAGYTDDRAVKILQNQIKTLRPNQVQGNDVSIWLAGPLAASLLTLGSEPAVDQVLKTVMTFSGRVIRPETGNRGTAQRLHQELARYSDARGWPAPAFNDQYDQDWRAWFKEHEDAFPDRLGKLKQPPSAPPAAWRGPRSPFAARPGRPQRQ